MARLDSDRVVERQRFPRARSLGAGRASAAAMPASSGLTARMVAIFAGIALMLTMVGLGPLMTIGDVSFAGEGDPVRQGLYLLAALLVAYGIEPLAQPRRLAAVPLPVTIVLAFCLVSIAWSLAPGIAFRRLVLTAVVAWTIFAWVRRVSFDLAVNTLRIFSVVMLIANYLAVLLRPDIGIHTFGTNLDLGLYGDWRGIMAHKNFAGAMCAITILLFFFDAKRIPIWLRLGVIAAAAFFLAMSASKTSIGMVVASIVVGVIFTRYDSKYRGFLLFLVFAVSIAATIFANVYRSPFSVAMSDKNAFTGRTAIWNALLDYIGDHPWLGTGYQSFWNIGALSPIYSYGRGWLLGLTAGHNGYLDLATQLGVPGLLLVLAMLIVWPLVMLFNRGASSGQRAGLLVGLMLFCVGHNFTESSLLERDVLVEVFLMLTVALIWKVTEIGALPARRARPFRLHV